MGDDVAAPAGVVTADGPSFEPPHAAATIASAMVSGEQGRCLRRPSALVWWSGVVVLVSMSLPP